MSGRMAENIMCLLAGLVLGYVISVLVLIL